MENLQFIAEYDARMKDVVEECVEEASEYFGRPGKVLVLGTGPGYDAHLLSGKGNSVTALDLEQARVDYARRNYGDGSVDYVQGDMRDLSGFGDGEFDALYSSAALNYLSGEEINKMVPELDRVLKGDGKLYVVVVNEGLFEKERRKHPERSEETMRRMYGDPYRAGDIAGALEGHFDVDAGLDGDLASKIFARKTGGR